MDGDPYTNGKTYGYAPAYGHAPANGHLPTPVRQEYNKTSLGGMSHRYSQAYCHPQAYRYAYPNPQPYTYVHSNPHSKSDTYTYADSNSQPYAHCFANPPNTSEPKGDGVPESDSPAVGPRVRGGIHGQLWRVEPGGYPKSGRPN